MERYIILTEKMISTFYRFKCLICGYKTEIKIFKDDTREIERHIELAHKK